MRTFSWIAADIRRILLPCQPDMERLAIRPVDASMLTLPHILGFLFAVPAPSDASEKPDRHKAIQALRLSPHILRDVGMEDYDAAANDPRWVQRPDLER